MKTDPAQLHDTLVRGLRDFVAQSGFESVILGLSGGIDSAVVAALAVEALGAGNVHGAALPTAHSSSHSVEDALALAQNLRIPCPVISIEAPYRQMLDLLAPEFRGLPPDTAEENIQPRLRALVLMALANKHRRLLLSTGNKSELAVGYCTLYGDMAGALAPLAGVYKTQVYALAEHINREREIIPRRTIEKPPSAELKPNQTDQDTLPPYDVLDRILFRHIEENLREKDLVALGFDEAVVRWVIRAVDRSEYKRKQAAPGLKAT